LVILLFFGLLRLSWLHRPEPAYHGKSLALWLQTYAPSSSSGRGSSAWSETDDAVRHIGTNSIPVLLKMLRATDSKLKLQLIALAKKQQVMKIHFTPATECNIEASRAFIVLGDSAKGAVLGLVEIYNEANSTDSQSAAEEALGWIGPAANPAIPMLLSAATNSNNKVRASALWTLGEIHSEPDLCVPELIRALGDSNDWAQISAAHALGVFGAAAQSAVPALKNLENFPVATGKFWANSMQVRFEARNALRKINPEVFSPSTEAIPGFEIPDGDPLFSPR
jgi:HEAT repeat protein